MIASPAHRPRYKRVLFWLGDRIAGIGLWVGAVALLVIVVLNAINIMLRYFFRTPLSWAEEAMPETSDGNIACTVTAVPMRPARSCLPR